MAAALFLLIRSSLARCATSAMPYILSKLLSALKRPVPSVPQALRVVNIDRKNTSSAGRSAGKARCSSRWTKVRCFDWDTPHPLGPATAPLVRPDFTPYVVARACSLSSGQGRVDERPRPAPSRLAAMCASEAAGGVAVVEVGRLLNLRAARGWL